MSDIKKVSLEKYLNENNLTLKEAFDKGLSSAKPRPPKNKSVSSKKKRRTTRKRKIKDKRIVGFNNDIKNLSLDDSLKKNNLTLKEAFELKLYPNSKKRRKW